MGPTEWDRCRGCGIGMESDMNESSLAPSSLLACLDGVGGVCCILGMGMNAATGRG